MSGFTEKKYQRARTAWLLATLAFLALGIALAMSRMQPTIHSCDVYIPDKFNSAVHLAQAVWKYVRLEGIQSLFSLMYQAVRLQISGFSEPSFYGVDEIRGKTLLMAGGGYIHDFLRRSRSAGVQIYLVDDVKLTNRTSSLVTKFMGIQEFGRVSVQDPESIVDLVRGLGVKFDGVFTLVEDNGPLASRLAEAFGLIGSPEAAALIARSKYDVRIAMQDAGLPTPKFARIRSESDIEAAAASVGFPSFLKPVYGVGALYGQLVHSREELLAFYRTVQSDIDPNSRPIYYYGYDMILEQLLDGSELQLELMLRGGELVYHCFSSQYAPGRKWLVFPVNFTDSEKSELLSLALATVKAVGLTDGVIHTEMFYSPTHGAQMIEINNRLSRGFLALHPVHQLLLGERLADYWASVMYLSMGLQPPVRDRITPLLSIAVVNDEPSTTGWETESACAVFVGTEPAHALRSAQDFYGSTEL